MELYHVHTVGQILWKYFMTSFIPTYSDSMIWEMMRHMGKKVTDQTITGHWIDPLGTHWFTLSGEEPETAYSFHLYMKESHPYIKAAEMPLEVIRQFTELKPVTPFK